MEKLSEFDGSYIPPIPPKKKVNPKVIVEPFEDQTKTAIVPPHEGWNFGIPDGFQPPSPDLTKIKGLDPSQESTKSIEKLKPSEVKTIEKLNPSQESTKAVEKLKPSEVSTIEKLNPSQESTKAIEKLNPSQESTKTIEKKKPSQESTKTIEKLKPNQESTKTIDK